MHTLVLEVSCVAIQSLHILVAEQLSLKPPRARAPRLSAETAARVPYITWGPFPVWNRWPDSCRQTQDWDYTTCKCILICLPQLETCLYLCLRLVYYTFIFIGCHSQVSSCLQRMAEELGPCRISATLNSSEWPPGILLRAWISLWVGYSPKWNKTCLKKCMQLLLTASIKLFVK